MNGLPEFIRLAGFELHGFIADGTDGKMRVRDVGHSSLRESSDRTRDRRPERDPTEGCVRDRSILTDASGSYVRHHTSADGTSYAGPFPPTCGKL